MEFSPSTGVCPNKISLPNTNPLKQICQITSALTFDNARLGCSSFGYRLLVIDSVASDNAFLTYLSGKGTNSGVTAWINGLTNAASVWFTVNSQNVLSPYTYQGLSPGPPNSCLQFYYLSSTTRFLLSASCTNAAISWCESV